MVDLMQQTRELLPCPFCGGEAERIDFGPDAAENEGGSCIACRRCQASGPVEFGFKENFIANWNTRAALRAAPEGFVMVPVELALRVEDSLGRFVSDEGWGSDDMGVADDLSGLLAARPQGVKDAR